MKRLFPMAGPAVIVVVVAASGAGGPERKSENTGDEGRRSLRAVGSQVTCVEHEEVVCIGEATFQTPSNMESLRSAEGLAFGLRHGCLSGEAGGVACWGDGLDGQLGVEARELTGRHFGRPARSDAAPVPGVHDLRSISAGWLHTCGVTRRGEVVCWGDNARGQLGREGDGPGPGAARGLGVVRSISGGGLHTCAIDSEGSVYCWGNGSYGQLGSGKEESSTEPVRVAGLAGGAIQVSAGGYHSCAVATGGTVACWGDNRFGQLGEGSTERRASATRVEGLTGPVRSLAAGSSFTCALLETGAIQCWGSNEFGELGLGGAPVVSTKPDIRQSAGGAVVGLAAPAIVLEAAEVHACAGLVNGEVFCWGANDSGQLGDGTVELRRAPVRWTGKAPRIERPAPSRDLPPPVEGIDVSYHSGRVNWAAAAAEGYRFGLMLATAGVDFRDPFLAVHWAHLRQTAMFRGAYHFYVSADDASEQARHFLSHVVLEPGDLPPVVDIESAAANEPPEDLAAQLRVFVEEIEASIGVKPIIYTSPNFWRDHVRAELGDHPLWIAEYEVEQPVVPSGWKLWHVWQWKANAFLPHIAPLVDLDRVHADVDLAELLIPEDGARHRVESH